MDAQEVVTVCVLGRGGGMIVDVLTNFLDTILIVLFLYLGTATARLPGQSCLFVAGAFTAGSPGKIFRAEWYVPLFLVWKLVIDILCITRLYRGGKWVRTRRH